MDILYANAAGQILANAWHGKDCEALIKKLKAPKPPTDYTLSLDGRWFKITIGQDEWDGQSVFALWTTDISASKQAESELRHAVEEADALAESKSNFLATMSHEIRTPMQSVYGLLELVEEEEPPANIQNMIGTAKDSASGLLEILDDILDFAKMDAHKMELDVFEVPVRTLVGGILEALSVRAKGKDIRLLGEIEEKVPYVIIGDPKRLRQILINLAGNAIKFTDKGSIVIHVTTKCQHIEQPSHGMALRFEISDTGVGMSKAVAARLFQPFTQADSSTARKFGGTGLGLSICKKLVELMGGQIGVKSKEGKGSIFWFEIPTEEVSTKTTTVKLPSLDGLSVLSVEDHPQGAKEIVRSLESMGATVESCSTCAEALALVKRRPFDVGVIDQGLPDGLGLNLVRDIMKVRPFMGLIMYTVRDDTGLQHSLQSLGITYLAKPASRVGLGEAIYDAAQKTTKLTTDGPTRLLIAEDTASVRDVLERQLEKLGVAADFVSNGKEAKEALATGKYGILFTDLHMPEIDGYELVGQIRAAEDGTEKHFPVIVLTADVQMAQRQVYLSHGFDECLLKPVSLGQFRHLLIRWGLLSEEDSKDKKDNGSDRIKNKKSKSATKGASSSKTKNALPPAIDVDAVKAQMGALDENTIEMLHMFVEMTQPLIDQIKMAQAHHDYPALHELAHSLKGGARSACCKILGDLAARLQNDADSESPACPDHVAAIEIEFARVEEAVKTLKPE